MSALPIEVRATFSVLTAYNVSVMSKVRRSSGTCWSAANEPELPCPLWPLTSIAALKDWVGVLRLSPQLVCCILLGSRVHTWAGGTGRPFCFVWPWFRLGQRELLLEQKKEMGSGHQMHINVLSPMEFGPPTVNSELQTIWCGNIPRPACILSCVACWKRVCSRGSSPGWELCRTVQ